MHCDLMLWKSVTTNMLDVAGLVTRGLVSLLSDHTRQHVSSDVSNHSNVEVRDKKPLCLSQDIAQVRSFNS
jgi:hypothetical protein